MTLRWIILDVFLNIIMAISAKSFDDEVVNANVPE